MADRAQQLGISGTIHEYDIVVIGDTVTVTWNGTLVTQRTVADLGTFVGKARDLRLGWGRFEDKAEVIYLYDKADGNFGYALNLMADWCSEWGYAPFS